MDSSLPGVLWMPTANHFDGRDGQAIRWIILHGTASGTDARVIANNFKASEGSSNPVSSHYVIGQDGTIVQCVAESDAAWGNGVLDGIPAANLPFRTASDGIHRDDWWNPAIANRGAISIEHCKPHDDNSDQLTPAQQAASRALIADICKRRGIPGHFADSSGGITGHFSLEPGQRQNCPGPYPWDALGIPVQGGTNDMLQITDAFAARHFKETSATSWLCNDTGLTVVSGILNYYRKTQGAFRLPLTSEIYGVIPGGSFQVFEAGVLVWDPQHKLDDPGQGDVYAMHLNKDTPGLRKLMAFAGLTAPPVTVEQLASAITSVKAASTSLAVAQSSLEPAHP